MLEIINQVSNNMKNKQLTGLVFLDLKKVLVMVSHDILVLIKNLECYGIVGQLKNYLSHISRDVNNL